MEEESLKGAEAQRDTLRLLVEFLEQQFTIAKSRGMEADKEKKFLQNLLKVEEERLKAAKVALRFLVEVLKQQFTIADSARMEAEVEKQSFQDLLRG